ncbi:MAG TPA: hypothetical protein VLI67_02835 [Vicinamibacteria bacterium]|nr:hypothetical protein [Vicinamibacteria bacterium]
MRPETTPRRVWAARLLAMTADFLQIGLFPFFFEGGLSPLNNGLDALVAIAMIALVGWHWAFLPAFLTELVPVVGLVPSWTAAVLIATRGAEAPPPPGALPPAPPPEREAGRPRPPSA